MRKSLNELFKEYGAVMSKDNIHDLREDFKKIAVGYGSDWVILTKEHIDALLEGKVLHLLENEGEYNMFIKVKEELK